MLVYGYQAPSLCSLITALRPPSCSPANWLPLALALCTFTRKSPHYHLASFPLAVASTTYLCLVSVRPHRALHQPWPCSPVKPSVPHHSDHISGTPLAQHRPVPWHCYEPHSITDGVAQQCLRSQAAHCCPCADCSASSQDPSACGTRVRLTQRVCWFKPAPELGRAPRARAEEKRNQLSFESRPKRLWHKGTTDSEGVLV